MADPRLFTIGHSNHDPARLLQILQQAGVTALADVRSSPYSQRHPYYNRPELEPALKQADIAYAFLGGELGGRPPEPHLYDEEGRVDYERVRRTARFQRGLERLCRALDNFTVVLLCAEEDPLDCHRGLMIAPALVEQQVLPAHLRGDGSVESTRVLEERLLALTKVAGGMLDGLFADAVTAEERAELLREAYRRQARRKAFRWRPQDGAGLGAEGDEAGYPD